MIKNVVNVNKYIVYRFMFYIIMGVSGSGKSTVGKLLSDRTGWQFFDADDFHPQSNIDKMSRGVPLTDSDRLPWLYKLHDLITDILNAGNQGILACSALKSDYRDLLSDNYSNGVVFIYLRGDYDCIKSRMKQRQGHFMEEDMLRSQFAALEEPKNAVVLDISLSPEEIVEEILKVLSY